MAEKKVTLPKIIYARWENEGTDDQFLMTDHEDEEGIADVDEKIIGVYKLVEVHATRLVTTTRVVKREVAQKGGV